MGDTPDTPDTYRVDVESHRAALNGIHGGLTPSQRSLQYVVSGIDFCFTGRVLKHEVSISESIRLRKHTKTPDQHQKLTFLDEGKGSWKTNKSHKAAQPLSSFS